MPQKIHRSGAEKLATKIPEEPGCGDIQLLIRVKKPSEFVPDMTRLCASAGVVFCLVPEIPGGKISGAAKWLSSDKALIALNLRGKTDDLFWFTFFHEAGHLLNDSKAWAA